MKTKAVALLVSLCLTAWAVADEVRSENTEARLQRQEVGNRTLEVGDGPDAVTIPRMLSYQGKLTDNLGSPVTDTTYSVAFRLYTVPSGGSAFWNETQTVRTRSGLFSVLLGSVTPISSMPDAGAVYLGMAVAGGAELTPRLRIASAAYAYLTARAANSDLLQGRDTTTFSRNTHNHDATYVNEAQADAITSAMIVNGTIAAADLGQMGASSGQVMKWNGSVWSPANDSVGSGGGSGTVRKVFQSTGVVLSPNPITDSGTVRFDSTWGDARFVNEAQANSVTGAMITDGQVSSADMRDTTITTAKLKDAAITAPKLGQMGASSGQVMKWTGSAWAPRNDSVGGGDNAWVRGSPDSVLFTVRKLGLARGGAGNVLRGDSVFSHVNLGAQCSTGNASYCIYPTVGGGSLNSATGSASTVAGGIFNRARADYATIAGGDGNIASSLGATVGGGYYDSAYDFYATVGGGNGNKAGAYCATVSGGYRNKATGTASAIGGGYQNFASGRAGFVGGGESDTAKGAYAAVLSGSKNTAGYAAEDTGAVVAGGIGNAVDWKFSAIGGGEGNTITGRHSTICGGYHNNVAHNGGLAAGFYNMVDNVAGVALGYADTVDGVYGFAANSWSQASYPSSAAFNGQATTASSQTRVGALSKASGTFTIDHPLDPHGRILNHYFIEGPEMRNIYDGEAVLDASGRAVVRLPDYFEALNRRPRVQLTGIGSSDVYLAEKVTGNWFVIGGRPGTEVYWQVTGERKDVSAEATRRMMPVEQPKTGPLVGRMLDDDFLVGCMDQLVSEGKAQGIDFRNAAGRAKYDKMRQHLREAETK